MVNTYGDTSEPGIITEETSTVSVMTGDEAPSDVCIVGQAALDSASNAATPNQVYQITRDTTAREWFGDESESLLTASVLDMFREGANPVYAVAPTAVGVTGEDISGLGSTSGTLANAPVSETATDTTFTVDGTALTTVITYEDPATETVDVGDVHLNPVTGDFELESAPGDADSTNDTVDYTHYDYVAALDAVEQNTEAASAIDFLVAANENSAVQSAVEASAKDMSAEQNYTIAFTAPGVRVDPQSYEQTSDSSRVQQVYPTRFDDGTSALAAYAGLRASLGLDRTAIRQRLSTNKSLAVSLKGGDRAALIGQRVVPLKNTAGGATVMDDKTTVDPTLNTDEANVQYGFQRMVLDYVYETVEANEAPFIGYLNRAGVRNALADLIAFELRAMAESNIVENYAVSVREVSSTEAALDLHVDAPEPLRFIHNNVTIGGQ